MSGTTALLPFQPTEMSPAQLAAVSYLARYSGHTHQLYAFQLRRWFAWCESNRLDPLQGIQRAHVELYIRQLGDSGLMDSSVVTMMHAVRGFFRFAHIDGLIVSDPAVYARLPKVHRDESRTQGLDRLELIRFLQVTQTLTVHHGALAYLLGIKRAQSVRSRGGADRGLRRDPARSSSISPARQGKQARHHANHRARPARLGGLPRPAHHRETPPSTDLGQPDRPPRRLPDGHQDRAGRRHPTPHQPASLRHAAITNALDAGVPLRDAQILARHADPRTTEHYDRARGNLDRHGVHFLTAYVAGV